MAKASTTGTGAKTLKAVLGQTHSLDKAGDHRVALLRFVGGSVNLGHGVTTGPALAKQLNSVAKKSCAQSGYEFRFTARTVIGALQVTYGNLGALQGFGLGVADFRALPVASRRGQKIDSAEALTRAPAAITELNDLKVCTDNMTEFFCDIYGAGWEPVMSSFFGNATNLHLAEPSRWTIPKVSRLLEEELAAWSERLVAFVDSNYLNHVSENDVMVARE